MNDFTQGEHLRDAYKVNHTIALPHSVKLTLWLCTQSLMKH